MKRINAIPLVLLSLVFTGCNHVEEPYTKKTYPVKGKITVDGKAPGSPIQINCVNKGEVDTEHPTLSRGSSDNDGVFELSSYTTGDGLPPGEYALTFVWKKFDLVNRGYSGPDKLKKRYDSPQKSKIEFSVKEGDEVDLGVIELTTK